jgi:hypothetical protein
LHRERTEGLQTINLLVLVKMGSKLLIHRLRVQPKLLKKKKPEEEQKCSASFLLLQVRPTTFVTQHESHFFSIVFVCHVSMYCLLVKVLRKSSISLFFFFFEMVLIYSLN